MSGVTIRPEGSPDPADKLDESARKYRGSDKGKEAEKRYNDSEKGKEAQKRYQAGEGSFLAQKKYRLSTKGKAAMNRYQEKVSDFRTILERQELGVCVMCGAKDPQEKKGRFSVCVKCFLLT